MGRWKVGSFCGFGSVCCLIGLLNTFCINFKYPLHTFCLIHIKKNHLKPHKKNRPFYNTIKYSYIFIIAHTTAYILYMFNFITFPSPILLYIFIRYAFPFSPFRVYRRHSRENTAQHRFGSFLLGGGNAFILYSWQPRLF